LFLIGVKGMATFRCSKCGCHDDTALCNYWSARVRDIPPVCSACDPKIGKWHGQFARLFGTFLVTPSPERPREAPASLVERLRPAEVGPNGLAAAGGTFDFDDLVPSYKLLFDDPIPSYKPLAASPISGAPVTGTAQVPNS
jgi:hypothetical protein